MLGVGVHAVDMEAALAAIAQAIEERRKGYVCLTDVHGVMEAQRDAALRDVLNRAFLNLPGGMPTAWVGRAQGHRGMDCVFGPDLMLEVCRQSESRGWRHFLYGGAPGVAPVLALRLRSAFPALRVVGTFTPPFRPLQPHEARELERLVARARPDVIWVALGTPRQEHFIAEFSERVDATLLLGVGAAFDFHSGRLRDAPRWVQRVGLLWVYRLLQDPRRLWRRHARRVPAFLVSLALHASRVRRYPLEEAGRPERELSQ